MDNENVGKNIGIYYICGICDERTNDGHLKYHVKCSKCGFETDMKLSDIKRVTTCKHINSYGGYICRSYAWKNQRIKAIFNKMVQRCYNNENKDYCYSGGKGIKICEEWLNNPVKFEEWALHYGYQKNLTIDRIDSDKDYSPDNCQWIPLEENARKAGKVNWITINDMTLTGKQWADKLNIGTNTINTAIRTYGIEKTQELILAMLKESPITKHRKPNQTWFSVYGIQV